MSDRITIEEEHFGILTDDALALEATLVRAAGYSDEEVRAVRVWLPKYPLTRSSVLPAARAEAHALGAESRAIYLTFDLRGSGLVAHPREFTARSRPRGRVGRPQSLPRPARAGL